MKLDDLIKTLTTAQASGRGDEEVMVAHASNGYPNHHESGVFPVLGVDLEHGVNLILSNYISGYVKKVFPDRNP